jgi:hypothetical protein
VNNFSVLFISISFGFGLGFHLYSLKAKKGFENNGLKYIMIWQIKKKWQTSLKTLKTAGVLTG